MTDLGLRIDKQRSPSFVLKGYFEQGRWSSYQLERERLVCCRLTWPDLLEPFSILDAPGHCWRFFWRSRDQKACVLGLGQVLAASLEQPELLTKTASEGWLVLAPFSPPSLDSFADTKGLWGDLAEGAVVLPQIEWAMTEQKIELTVRVLVSATASSSEIQQALNGALRDHLPMTLSQENRELPKLVAKTDKPQLQSWRKLVANATNAIKAGSFDKVVLSRMKELQFDRSVDMAPVLRRLSQLSEDSYLFAVRSPSGIGFLGRSPERLLAWTEDSYFLDAIAGTRRRSANRSLDFTEAASLRSSAKELSEHRFVTEYVTSILKDFTTHTEQVERESLLRLQNVQHIRSSFRGERIPEQSPFALLKALHPTPAVGGLPKKAAISFIEANEGIARGLFAGAFGLVRGLEEGELALGIRSALLKGEQLYLYAGAGIVAESVPEWEWQETEVKMKNFTDVFLV